MCGVFCVYIWRLLLVCNVLTKLYYCMVKWFVLSHLKGDKSWSSALNINKTNTTISGKSQRWDMRYHLKTLNPHNQYALKKLIFYNINIFIIVHFCHTHTLIINKYIFKLINRGYQYAARKKKKTDCNTNGTLNNSLFFIDYFLKYCQESVGPLSWLIQYLVSIMS